MNRRLVILVSNLGNVQRLIDLPKIGRKPMIVDAQAENPDNLFINPGQHRVLEFHYEAGKWLFDSEVFIGLDNNRNGVGIGAQDPPEN